MATGIFGGYGAAPELRIQRGGRGPEAGLCAGADR